MTSVKEILSFAYSQSVKLHTITPVNSWIKLLQMRGSEEVRLFNRDCMNRRALPDYLSEFLRFKACLIYPLGMYETTGYGFKDVNSKQFTVWNGVPIQFFTSTTARKNKSSYTIERPIIISEGVKDAEMLGTFYPFSFSCLTSSISLKLAEFLSFTCGGVIFFPDNDKAGRAGAKRTQKNLEKYNVRCHVYHIANFKDASDVFEAVMEKDEKAIEELTSIAKYLKLLGLCDNALM